MPNNAVVSWAQMAPGFRTLFEATPEKPQRLKQVVNPEALDDAGAVCAAMIKLSREDGSVDLRPLINRYIDFIANKQFRLADKPWHGTGPKKIRCGWMIFTWLFPHWHKWESSRVIKNILTMQ
jgi:hypothetical protein